MKKPLDKKRNSCYNIITGTKNLKDNITKGKRKNHEGIY